MRTILSLLVTILFILSSCSNNNKTMENNQEKQNNLTPNDWKSQYDKVDPSDLPDNVIELIGKEWMLITAGNKNSYNTMTASWGGIGFIWNKPSTFVFVRDSRYTYEFLQREESFTLSFFPEQYRKALTICGSKSGRDTDKVKEAGLTPMETTSGLMSFQEARMIIECKKMFVQELDYENLTEPYKSKIMEESYNKEPSKHQLFISEIVNVWIKK
jgi:flavin reductase (DIM6/NTAB) family NADH-FMN oxidoreductase RutF